MARASAYAGGSSDSQREERVFDWAGVLFPERFVLGLQGGARVALTRAEGSPERPKEPQGRWLAPGVAYIQITSFAKPAFEVQALDLVRRFFSARTLIVDVRGNEGGTEPTRLIEALMDRPYRRWAGSTPLNVGLANVYVDGAFPHQMLGDADAYHHGYVAAYAEHFRRAELRWESPVEQPAKTPFRGRLLLLVDRACGSAGEDFVMPFKDNGRATLLGEHTAGNDGQPYWYAFGNGMRVAIGAVEDRFPDGSPFDGIGIAPDIEIEETVDSLRAGRDPVLERARELAPQP
ncbi:MAG: S41 family peptidase [Myxococcales bacterium]